MKKRNVKLMNSSLLINVTAKDLHLLNSYEIAIMTNLPSDLPPNKTSALSIRKTIASLGSI
jgi:hypothetical protein